MPNLSAMRPTSLKHRAPTRAGLLALALLMVLPAGALAQDAARIIERGGDPNFKGYEAPEWKETDVPPPPAFDVKRLLSIEMPPYMSLKFGIDPATLAITGDGIVRYVVVASSNSGAVNAFYEGVRCATEEVKMYARYNSGAWQQVESPEWKRIGNLNSLYVKELSKQALCRGHAPRASISDMLREMRSPEQLAK
jgi:hypothetical protein